FGLEPFDEVVVHVEDLHEVGDVGLEALAGLRAMAEDRGARFAVEGMAEPLPRCLRPRPAAGGVPADGG
ncbi:MAG TPA: hypothetical protein VKW77_04780, partial [Acidimicrobiales bacterium]|nr:hypothetical protein [Acidimicrobiales bacterium]